MQPKYWVSEGHGVADRSPATRPPTTIGIARRPEKARDWRNGSTTSKSPRSNYRFLSSPRRRLKLPRQRALGLHHRLPQHYRFVRLKAGSLDPRSGNDGGREALLRQILEVGSRKPAQTASNEVAPEEQGQRGLSADSTVCAHISPSAPANQGTEQAESARAIATTLHSKSMNNPTTQTRKLPPPPIPPKPRSVLPTASPSAISKPQPPAIRNNDVPTISSDSAPEVHKAISSPLPLLPKPAQFNTATATAAPSQNPYPHTLLPNKTHRSTSTRIFTSNCGTWSVQAQLLDWKAGKVWLRKINNVKISVPLSRFSGADVEHILTEMMQRAEESVSDIDGVRAECQGAGNAVTA